MWRSRDQKPDKTIYSPYALFKSYTRSVQIIGRDEAFFGLTATIIFTIFMTTITYAFNQCAASDLITCTVLVASSLFVLAIISCALLAAWVINNCIRGRNEQKKADMELKRLRLDKGIAIIIDGNLETSESSMTKGKHRSQPDKTQKRPRANRERSKSDRTEI